MKTYKRINEPLLKNDVELFAIGDTSNEIIGEASNWELLKTKTIWDLKDGDEYYWLTGSGEICIHEWLVTDIDKMRRVQGNIFLTREEAEEEIWRRKFETKMKRVFKPEECDWSNHHVNKFCIICNNGTPVIDYNWKSKHQGIIYCNDYETVERFIEEHEEALKRYFKMTRGE